jgi:hypothetical protein
MIAIVNGISFYTTKTAILEKRAGDDLMLNQALHNALIIMGKDASVAVTLKGFTEGSFEMRNFDIQLSV